MTQVRPATPHSSSLAKGFMPALGIDRCSCTSKFLKEFGERKGSLQRAVSGTHRPISDTEATNYEVIMI